RDQPVRHQIRRVAHRQENHPEVIAEEHRQRQRQVVERPAALGEEARPRLVGSVSVHVSERSGPRAPADGRAGAGGRRNQVGRRWYTTHMTSPTQNRITATNGPSRTISWVGLSALGRSRTIVRKRKIPSTTNTVLTQC